MNALERIPDAPAWEGYQPTVVPAVGAVYRHLETGKQAKCVKFEPVSGLVSLCQENRARFYVWAEVFWDEWIHADLYDPTRN